MRRVLALFLLPFLLLSHALLRASEGPVKFGGGGEFRFISPRPDLTDAQREAIKRMLRENEKRLIERGIIRAVPSTSHPLLSWPLRQAKGAPGPGYWETSNFVDHDPAHPGHLLDYYGGKRTYDTESADHTGTDFVSWPFPWAKFYVNEVLIVAAAPGIVLGKDDGQFDRNCGYNPSSPQWNAVFIRHDDGSQAWYGHLKNGTLTQKAVGERVSAGEALGVMGSSGNSTVPHLHFEVYDSSGKLNDPYSGPFNRMNSETWWKKQRAYRDSSVNTLLTHSAPPDLSKCPHIEATSVSARFKPGQTVYFAAYYRDQQAGDITQYSVLRPDGKVEAEWIHACPETQNASWWWWCEALPANAQPGTWRFQAAYRGKTSKRAFTVGGESDKMVLTGLSPAAVWAGQEVEIRLVGKGFKKGMSASVYLSNQTDDPGIIVRSVEVKSAVLAVMKAAAGPNAAAGFRSLILTCPDYAQASKKNAFKVLKS